MVCPVCRRNHGLGDPESPPPPGFAPESSREENTEEEEAAESTEVWCGAWRPPPWSRRRSWRVRVRRRPVRARRYHTWMNGTLLLEACGGEWETSVVQLVHPVFGDIGHYV